MKTLKSFLVLITILFVACLFTGCTTTTSLDTKEKRCTAYSDAYSLYLATAEIREVSKDEKAAASAAAIFLRTWCGWTAPKGGPGDTHDKNGVPIVYPPKPKARASRSAAPAMRAGPVPVGPPAPGRTMAVPLEWDHNPLADQAREYWLYWARSTNVWDARITIPTAAGQTFRWTTSQAGFARFAVTSARPPNAALGEKEWVESDPSNELTLVVSGFPNKPDRLRTPLP